MLCYLDATSFATLFGLQAVHKRPIECIENDKGTGKQKARSAINPVGYLLRRHCRPSGLSVSIAAVEMTDPIRQCLRRVSVQWQRQRAGGCWFHVHDGIVAVAAAAIATAGIFRNVLNALRRRDGGNVLRWETLKEGTTS